MAECHGARIAQQLTELVQRLGRREAAYDRTIRAAHAHLGAALAQALPSDDQIILDHVRRAYDLLSVQYVPCS